MSAARRLVMTGIHKRFGGVHALRGATLEARGGEILGLCGENGAGKSTLLKILSGVYPYRSYDGDILLDERPLRIESTAQARRHGIAIVHQELMLIPGLSVAENLFLGRERRRLGLIDDDQMEKQAAALLARFGLGGDIDVRAPVGGLGVGLMQVIEIVRALAEEAAVLVLDEPTAALSATESARLMELLRDLRAGGATCIYVSHRMDEIFSICDRVTVLRDGSTAGTVVTAESSPEQVVRMMLGEAAARVGSGVGSASGKAGIEVVGLGLFAKGKPPRRILDDISFAVAAGEVVALCGAMGSGRTALLSTLFGCARGPCTGTVRVAGKESACLSSPRAAIADGICLVPEDRKGSGLMLDMTVADNLTIPALARGSRLLRGGLIDEEQAALLAERRCAELHVRGRPGDLASTLSGGNQQKVVLGKWLDPPPGVLLLDEPTRGVDIGAREEIYGLIEGLARRGAAVLLASSDLSEVFRLARRVLVLRAGRIAAALHVEETTREEVLGLMTLAGGPARGAA